MKITIGNEYEITKNERTHYHWFPRKAVVVVVGQRKNDTDYYYCEGIDIDRKHIKQLIYRKDLKEIG